MAVRPQHMSSLSDTDRVSDSNVSIELLPSLFVRASATWGECLNYRGGPNKDGGSSIEAYESRKSHGEIGDCEQSADRDL